MRGDFGGYLFMEYLQAEAKIDDSVYFDNARWIYLYRRLESAYSFVKQVLYTKVA
jgi:hypothetical protein